MCLPIVGEDILIVGVSLPGLLSQLPDALLLLLIGLVCPHQPHLQEQQRISSGGFHREVHLVKAQNTPLRNKAGAIKRRLLIGKRPTSSSSLKSSIPMYSLPGGPSFGTRRLNAVNTEIRSDILTH